MGLCIGPAATIGSEAEHATLLARCANLVGTKAAARRSGQGSSATQGWSVPPRRSFGGQVR